MVGISLTKWAIWAWAHFQFRAKRSVPGVKEAGPFDFLSNQRTNSATRTAAHLLFFFFLSFSVLTSHLISPPPADPTAAASQPTPRRPRKKTLPSQKAPPTPLTPQPEAAEPHRCCSTTSKFLCLFSLSTLSLSRNGEIVLGLLGS